MDSMNKTGRRTGWFKASYTTNANACVEVRFDGESTRLRDSKNPDGPAFAFGSAPWRAFLTEVSHGSLGR
jgi:hypothetical protein